MHLNHHNAMQRASLNIIHNSITSLYGIRSIGTRNHWIIMSIAIMNLLIDKESVSHSRDLMNDVTTQSNIRCPSA